MPSKTQGNRSKKNFQGDKKKKQVKDDNNDLFPRKQMMRPQVIKYTPAQALMNTSRRMKDPISKIEVKKKVQKVVD